MDNDKKDDGVKEMGYSLFSLVQMYEDGTLDSLQSQLLAETPPHVLSDFLSRIDVDTQRKILRKLSEEKASDVVSEMNPEDSAELLSEMRESRAASLLNEMEPGDAADLVGELDETDRDRILDCLEESQPETAETVRELLEYDPDTAAGLMNPNISTLSEDVTVDDAISLVRKTKNDYESMHYLYVIDANGVLVGVISMRDLVLARHDALIKDIMNTNLIGILRPTMDKELVAQIMADTNFHALPVVDEDGVLMGVVTHDDVLDVLVDEGTEDIQKMAGAGADETLFDGVFSSIKSRAPWLMVNLLTAFVASSVVGAFQDEISHLALLAVFMPIIAGIGGNTGAQTLAITVRSLAMGEVELFDAPKVCVTEALKGFLNGLLIGFFGAIIAVITTHRFDFAAVVWVAMILNMTMGGFVGCAIPFALKKFGLDPAAGSSIFTTGLTDSGGFLIFLGIGSLVLL
ncbi:MAG: magnesium transporter [Opitutales bacterium]|nr:magnesium transporter [Opitutales bacterium]